MFAIQEAKISQTKANEIGTLNEAQKLGLEIPEKKNITVPGKPGMNNSSTTQSKNQWTSYFAFNRKPGKKSSSRGFNGVAVFVKTSKFKVISATQDVFNDPELDDEGRAILIDFGFCKLINIYAPFANSSDKDEARKNLKIRFMTRLEELYFRTSTSNSANGPKNHTILLGDFNITYKRTDCKPAHRWLELNADGSITEESGPDNNEVDTDTGKRRFPLKFEVALKPETNDDESDDDTMKKEKADRIKNERKDKITDITTKNSDSDHHQNSSQDFDSQPKLTFGGSSSSSSSVVENKKISELTNKTNPSFNKTNTDSRTFCSVAYAMQQLNVKESFFAGYGIPRHSKNEPGMVKWLQNLTNPQIGKAVDIYDYIYGSSEDATNSSAARERFTVWNQFQGERFRNNGTRIDFTLMSKDMFAHFLKRSVNSNSNESVLKHHSYIDVIPANTKPFETASIQSNGNHTSSSTILSSNSENDSSKDSENVKPEDIKSVLQTNPVKKPSQFGAKKSSQFSTKKPSQFTPHAASFSSSNQVSSFSGNGTQSNKSLTTSANRTEQTISIPLPLEGYEVQKCPYVAPSLCKNDENPTGNPNINYPPNTEERAALNACAANGGWFQSFKNASVDAEVLNAIKDDMKLNNRHFFHNYDACKELNILDKHWSRVLKDSLPRNYDFDNNKLLSTKKHISNIIYTPPAYSDHIMISLYIPDEVVQSLKNEANNGSKASNSVVSSVATNLQKNRATTTLATHPWRKKTQRTMADFLRGCGAKKKRPREEEKKSENSTQNLTVKEQNNKICQQSHANEVVELVDSSDEAVVAETGSKKQKTS